ncbi:MAG: amidohydrolase family protein [Gemmatimonadetes bacterium]|nr:amidohydrolase family protein [Gemmatimonadota bacterium]
MSATRRSLSLFCLSLLLTVEAAAQQWNPGDPLILRGDLVTMNETLEVISGGRLILLGEKIAAVLRPEEPLPSNLDLSRTLTVETDGWIFPGLIDSHNHVSYNVLPLYDVPQRYTNRYQWSTPASYRRRVNGPEKLLTERAYYNLASEVVKYAEVKAIVGGVTSIQGSPDLVATRLLTRNIEHFNFGQDQIYQRTLAITYTRFDPSGLRQKMAQRRVDAWLVHLAEGVDSLSRAEFDVLKRLGLLGDMTVIIHGTALSSTHFQEMATAGTKLVWSPLSNLLLYGETTDIPAALAVGVIVALGSDWSPSGSKNLLGELKVADGVDRTRFGNVISDTMLVQMVTRNPAFVLGLDDKIGQLRPGLYGDIAVFEKVHPNPYRSLIESNERHVRLVLVGGDPVYGDREIMEQLKPDDHELLLVDGLEKALDLTDPRVPWGGQTLAEIRQLLEQAMLFDREHMWEIFGGTMDKEQFDAFLDEKFKAGIVAKPLDPLLAFGDTAFFRTLERSIVANLGFDVARYWLPRTPEPPADPELAFINSDRATFETLDLRVALDRRAARNIVAHRDGPDGRRGTADDNPFDDLEELIRIPYVGRSALAKLRSYVISEFGIDARVLVFLKRRETTLDVLVREVGLTRRTAERILQHRNGSDGQFGTADDNPLDNMAELDAIQFVGPATLEKLRLFVSTR